MVEQVDELVTAMIGEAVLAGAYAETMRRLPETRAGFEPLRARHSDAVEALAAKIAVAVLER